MSFVVCDKSRAFDETSDELRKPVIAQPVLGQTTTRSVKSDVRSV